MEPGSSRGLPPALTEIHLVKPVLIPDYSRSSQTWDYNFTSASALKAEREVSEFQSK